jgi:hypothetical protein
MAKKTRKLAKSERLVKVTNGWRKPFRRGDKVTLIQRGRDPESLVVKRVLSGQS